MGIVQKQFLVLAERQEPCGVSFPGVKSLSARVTYVGLQLPGATNGAYIHRNLPILPILPTNSHPIHSIALP